MPGIEIVFAFFLGLYIGHTIERYIKPKTNITIVNELKKQEIKKGKP